MNRERCERMMRLALAEAEAARIAGEIPVGAVLAKGDTVIAKAHNERQARPDPTAHAEVLALRRGAEALGDRRLSGCTLYVTLEPCVMCAGAIVLARPNAVVFGAYDAEKGCCGSVYALTNDKALGGNIPCVGGVLAEECAALLTGMLQTRRNEGEKRC